MSSELIAPGEIIRDTWKVGFVIGQGGMGTAFLATDVNDNTKVAIKALSPQVATSDSLERFEREAALLAKFQHPNIVRILWVGRHRELPVIAMSYVEGSSLRAFARSKGGESLPLHQVLPLARQMCAALTQIHAHGVVHRDLKPQNILVDSAGRLTLLDFGIARPSDSQLTRTGVVWGTPGYISPEVIVGEKVITGAADQYAVGAIVFELLTGFRPFQELEEEEALLRAHLLQPRPNPCDHVPGLAKEVGAVVQRAMALRPEDRFPSADELYLALEQAAMAQLAGAAAPAPAPPSRRRAEAGGDAQPAPRKRAGEAPTGDADAKHRRTGENPAADATRRRTGESAAADATRRRTGENPAADATAPLTRRLSGESPAADATAPLTARRRTGENPTVEPDAATRPTQARSADADTDPVQPTHRVSGPRTVSKTLDDEKPDPLARYRWPVIGGLGGVLLIAFVIGVLRPPPEPPPLKPIEKILPIAPPTPGPQLQSSIQMQERTDSYEKYADKAAELAKSPPRVRPRVVRQKSTTYAGPAGVGELSLVVLVKGTSVPADVLVDGQPQGQSPMFMPLTPGTHQVIIRRRPFPENVLPIEVKARNTTRLEVELQELGGGESL